MQLVELDLSFNKISDLGAKLLSNMLRSEFCLTDLDLSHNDITSYGCNRLSFRLKDTLSLQNLNLSVNRIDDSGAIDLFKALSANQTVLSIALSSNRITHTSLASLTNLVQQNHTIVTVDLSGNEFRRPISDDDFSDFIGSLASNPSKPHIDLRGCGLTPSQKTMLDAILHANTENSDKYTILPSKLFSLPPQLVG
jgi:Ran GTPase-activating protein (RanGAP) involved in mRNA processing and transport